MEFFISFDPITDTPDSLPPAATPIDALDIHADLIAPADRLGTYPDPAFPDSVPPAPRVRGPDGRDEGRVYFEPQADPQPPPQDTPQHPAPIKDAKP